MMRGMEGGSEVVQGISEIVGAGQTGEGARCVVYRALRPLFCDTCGVEILEGHLFTRWPLPGQKLNIMPRCRKCTPFKFDESEARNRQQSALLKSLLTRQQETETQAPAADPSKIAEAVERRLGPALSRVRRSRKPNR
ncbi:MAG TPA: hypothetical protein VGB73_07830 [Pyrinomonadaceae bacterium]